ncbi:hypothetical protein EYC80_005841 [Monilinia laxa]|uniref:Uncharacterized protein n=1 Tax=Monilinia laxa TaxID=61186 RepID=A0A5N6KFG4_MONLA|nr:hypothetical protein EYC80_005841 [Monilinia laxa]
MHFQHFILTAILLPLAVAAPITTSVNNEVNKSTRTVDKSDIQGTAPSSFLRARQVLWDVLGPFDLEPVIDGLNAAIVGAGLK